MTLDEAILYCEEKTNCIKCGEEHKQIAEWLKNLKTIEINKDKFYEAYNYLYEHPMFKNENGLSKFNECLDVNVVKVNPLTCMIDDNDKFNTKTEVWLETGKYDEKSCWHDYDLDCGGDTYEEAIIELANNVKYYYGNQKEKLFD